MSERKKEYISPEEFKEVLEAMPSLIRKTFKFILDKQKEIEERGKEVREVWKRGARKGKAEPI